jgi:hypothetical protein
LKQFNRICSVVLKTTTENIIITGLRITFSVDKTVVGTSLNRAKIAIYNLSAMTRGKIDDKDTTVILNAGYEDPGQMNTTLFTGQLTLFKHSFEPPNVITHLEAYDGVEEVASKITFGQDKNTTPYKVLQQIAKEAKLDIDFKGITINELKNKIMSAGYAFTGKLQDAMDEVSETIDADWSIEDKNIKILTRGQAYPGLVTEIDETSGLIGVPEKIDDVNTRTGHQKRKNMGKKSVAPGYMINSLLNPSFKPGTLIHLKSIKLNIDTQCVIHAVTHKGDTHGQEWNSLSRALLQ